MTIRRRWLTVGFGVLTILGGMTGVAFGQSESAVGRNIGSAGILTALGGFLAILGTQIQPILKVYLDNQRLQFDVQTAVNEARAERHMIIQRMLYDEERVDRLFQKVFPDGPPPTPPPFPSERETFPAVSQSLAKRT